MSRAFEIGIVGPDKYGKTHPRLRFVFTRASWDGRPQMMFVRWGRSDSPAGYSILNIRNGRYRVILLPFVRWGKCYRFRRFGGLRFYAIQQRLYRLVTGTYL